MTSTSRTPPRRVPTLTEVVEFVDLTEPARDWERTQRFVAPVAGVATAPDAGALVATIVAANEAPATDDAALEARLVDDVQQRVASLIEQRLRESLARLADAVVADVRAELASALRDTVVRAVADELARQRAR